MGNCSCSCKCCRTLCQEEEDVEEEEDSKEEPIPKQIIWKSIYDFPRNYPNILNLNKGDLLQVIGESEDWVFVRKCTQDDNQQDFVEGYVPRMYIKPANSLEANIWYFENVENRIDAKRCLLRPDNDEGAFLVWRSTEKNCFYLSVKNGPHARHYKITEQESDKRFYLVERQTFASISELVESYSKHQDGLCTLLTQPCIMRDQPPFPSLSHDAEWEVNRRCFTKMKKLGSGEFGQVWQGRWRDFMDVAIKEFKVISPEIQTEIKIMKELQHERLLKLYAVCTVDEPFCIITELIKNGSLKKYLISHKEMRDIEYSLMMDFAVQITEGMAYLESKNIIHRDLRADNILLTEMLSCKIADFGLAEFTFANDRRLSSSMKVPIKWMAPEIFDAQQYTTKCDVWSFGILLTEIITYGDDPYPDLDKAACIQAVRRGYKMAQPPDCPPELYNIMLLCWKTDPKERPEFKHLQKMLTDLLLEPTLEIE